MRTVIYPGSFDPMTNGHLDVIQRASRLFDRVVVAIARNGSKQPLFTTAERRALIEQSTDSLDNVSVDIFEGLLVEYVERQSGHAVIRGLRALSDFEYEFQMALMNRKLNEKVETLFMMPRASYSFLSSHLVKEIATLGGDVSAFVTPGVREALTERLGQAGAN
ncbi:MAG: pantetheine-phosphate adenylyltransferase [Verrucomicrobiota bacterium]|nr:pantetheine-phosphate adenylyltransferase [Acidimicrobiales bacterium]MDP6250516.1 pantetheine-phosphate adenylyltransferase [Verrucomicrobiota bacterium]MDP7177207.1 pantetheine-phosphate adenylyltransferase [Verrucomicrobiota bacterium]MDP7293656.1 pantetheine-phosphate adenylyltransferase [Verrucomicrobiota bacterium]MDP7440523.1 pantetheine-phosphate adenylyltransferase [Verrucomicrobiota bacterium]